MIWLNGDLQRHEAARIDPADRGFLLGDGLFETILAVDGRPIRLEDHLFRLAEGARILEIPLPLDVPGIAAGVHAVLEANGLVQGKAAIRVTLTRGPGGRGLVPPEDPAPSLLISASEYRVPAVAGFSAKIVPQYRRNEGSPLSRLKTLCYLDGVLALSAAVKAGHDEALLMNNAGSIVCASRANLFARLGDRLVTPPSRDGILPGITRKLVIEIAESLNQPVTEASLDAAEIAGANEAFITNSLLGIVALRRIDRRELDEGEFCQALRGAYRDLSE